MDHRQNNAANGRLARQGPGGVEDCTRWRHSAPLLRDTPSKSIHLHSICNEASIKDGNQASTSSSPSQPWASNTSSKPTHSPSHHLLHLKTTPATGPSNSSYEQKMASLLTFSTSQNHKLIQAPLFRSSSTARTVATIPYPHSVTPTANASSLAAQASQLPIPTPGLSEVHDEPQALVPRNMDESVIITRAELLKPAQSHHMPSLIDEDGFRHIWVRSEWKHSSWVWFWPRYESMRARNGSAGGSSEISSNEAGIATGSLLSWMKPTRVPGGGETGSCVGVEEMGYRQERCHKTKVSVWWSADQTGMVRDVRNACARAGQGGLEDRDSC